LAFNLPAKAWQAGHLDLFGIWILAFGIYLVFGAWNSGFGAERL
jgi:hypothetical protein